MRTGLTYKLDFYLKCIVILGCNVDVCFYFSSVGVHFIFETTVIEGFVFECVIFILCSADGYFIGSCTVNNIFLRQSRTNQYLQLYQTWFSWVACFWLESRTYYTYMWAWCSALGNALNVLEFYIKHVKLKGMLTKILAL